MPEKQINLEELLSGGAAPSEDVDLDSLLNPPAAEANPLEKVEYTGRVETDAVSEADAVRTGFKKRAAREQKRFKDATSTEYYSIVCFQTEEQKEALLELLKIPRRGRPHFQKYIPAEAFVRAVNRLVEEGRTVELIDPDITYRETGPDRKLEPLT